MSKPPDHYLNIDWAVIPVKPSSKEPVNKNWPALRLTASDLEKYFPTGEENIGVLLGEPSGGLIDIDLDCAEAIELAPAILPPTRTFGRQSKPQSHYLYKVNSPPATQRFSVDGRTLLELRSTGAQTIFPGSKHPKGEAIQFDDDTELVTEMTPQELVLRTRVLAVMTLMARHWVSFKGTRQDIAMALSDVLLKTQLAPAIARNVLVQMLTIAEDEERQDRLQAFDSTQTKLEGKETTVGWKLLQDRLPANIYSRVQEWLGDDDEPSQAMSLADILGPQVPSMTQSMALIDGRAYAASQYPDQKGKPHPIIVRDDMTIFSALKDTQDLGRLPFSLNLNLSSLGQERWFANSTQPDPIDVFNEMMRVLDQFMDFDRSFGTQQEMRELAVCYAMGTWFLPAFSTIGYLFANGAAGSGKTKFLEVMSKLCFRARILAGTSTTPAVREQASLGGTICLDDDESLGQKGGERMSLLLTSNRRGSETIMREGQKGNTWANRTVDAFCPFVISAINRPYETLAQRSIIIRIVRSGDAEKTARDVLEPSHWPDGIHQQDIHDSMVSAPLATQLCADS